MKEKTFRNELAQTVFQNKYAHDNCETWGQLADTLVDDVCGDKLKPAEKSLLKKNIEEMKFIPGGRYLYYAGRKTKFFNNCFTGDTTVLTECGWDSLKHLSETQPSHGGSVSILSPTDGQYKTANYNHLGQQQVNEVTFKPARGRSKTTYTVKVTRDHHWPVLDTEGELTDTYDLRLNDIVPASAVDAGYNAKAWLHGFVYYWGDSTGGLIVPEQSKFLPRLHEYKSSWERKSGKVQFRFHEDVLWTTIPFPGVEKEFDAAYIGSFIKGIVDAAGTKRINTTDDYLAAFLIRYLPLAGLVFTGVEKYKRKPKEVNGRVIPANTVHRITFQKGRDFPGWRVVSIKDAGVEDVFCPREPEHETFILEGGIQTFNCYLLRSEEDSREDWAELSKKAELCLLTGGGIGNDYSIYRPEHALIKNTGGFASGPIPKMQMINEIGRRIMQGGSRRSAIYASLNWRHDDVLKFLKAKNWDEMSVGDSGLSLADVKRQDFNFPAPLDMTNISVNYDNHWLFSAFEGDLTDVFLQNVEQALRTAEPGFSFNFFDKENETLRNACTEVTSEDDSDVCNLGSINLSRIESVYELADVVLLATKFLLLGTTKADLPYEKVYQIREKNRRLGLGLMGVHEWLIQRGYGYEVTPELHNWLQVYKGVSDHVSREFADTLGVSRPVANRAIAPTGTIGIIAGTTTGIEPIFAVAYKRRYLKDGTRWKYQYAVDHSAEQLIKLHDIDPDSIETALELAKTPEKRIKFQADVQDYVDQGISSTINLPQWGSKFNNPDTVHSFAETLAHYAPRLRGFTAYPDGARGGQPITPVSYKDAVDKLGEEYEEHVETNENCKEGVCGI